MYLTAAGITLLNLIEEIKKYGKITNYKNLNISSKAHGVLIEKYSK